jgi:anaerobic magnesium-protoporphyrin IX monomethyl ester cyclase
MSQDTHINLGTRTRQIVPVPRYPDAGSVIGQTQRKRSPDAVDMLLVNPPAPDGGIWIRSQHRVGRKSRENMIWPQVSLAQLAAILAPEYSVAIIDAIAERLTWPQFEKRLRAYDPKFYMTQVSAPTLQNDMYGVFVAKSVGARTIAFGTHVTPMARQTLQPYPALDFCLRGEPEATLRELLDTLEGKTPSNPHVAKMLKDTGSKSVTAPAAGTEAAVAPDALN